ncbi:hypothetical protein RclHR1_00470014 [Rhizophagus clarus]|uniref:NYN domain-containing protein n=1 Tax=Rhizophagus clarus TaxID=94130 RepID=A0A2Z6RK04_9GLOM|nr:hypothetical protein RclHR1_00470014 [Rhizophagus clarus]GES91949.1 NYN domain-containing protein [Rhizophagus clarus]
MSDIHSVKIVEGWNVDYVKKFLNLNKENFSLNDDEIRKLEELGINGRALLRYTKKKLMDDGLRSEPACNLADYISRLNRQKRPIVSNVFVPIASTVATERSPKSPNNSVSICIDNSNLFIEGSKVISYLEKVNAFDHKKPDFLNFYVDHGLLVTTVLKGRKLNKIYVIGSVPPLNDTIWTRTRDQCEIKTYERNSSNKEKKVDMEFVCDAMVSILTENPGTLSLVSDNDGYCPLMERAEKKNWKIETWFWSGLLDKEGYPFATPTANDLRKISLYEPLDNYYWLFTYITGPDYTNKKHHLEIRGNVIKDWKYRNETLMECFCALKLFGRWNWVDGVTANLYFENKKHLESAKSLLEHKYPGLWLTAVIKKKFI